MIGLKSRKRKVLVTQILVVGAFLLAWQYLPAIPGASHISVFLNSFFISSPQLVAIRTYDLFTGSAGYGTIYSYLIPTVVASVVGTAIGMLLGGAIGLFLSSFDVLRDVFRPIVVAVNAIPRIALIPVVVIIFGPTFRSTIAVVVMTTFFVAFFNAYEGGRVVSSELINSVTILGGSQWQVMRRVRLLYVTAWTFASLPLSITFALLSAVTAEILTSAHGLGALITQAQVTTDASTTFAVAFVLSVIGVGLVVSADLARNRLLHWWGKGP